MREPWAPLGAALMLHVAMMTSASAQAPPPVPSETKPAPAEPTPEAPSPREGGPPAPPAAPTKPSPAEQAVDHYDDAMKAMEQERYGDAAAAFERAYEMDRDPVLVWNIGYAREKNGELGLAKGHYTDFLAHEDVPGTLRKKAHERVLAIEAQLRTEEEARQAKEMEERLREQLRHDMAAESKRKAEIEARLREELKKELQAELQKELEASNAELDRKQQALREKDATIARKEREAALATERADADRLRLEEEQRKQEQADAKRKGKRGGETDEEAGRFSAVGTTHRFGYRQRPRKKLPSRVFLRGLIGTSGKADHKADGPLEAQSESGPVSLGRTLGVSMLYESSDAKVFTTGVVLRAMSWRRDVELLDDDGFDLSPSPRNLALDLAMSFKWGLSFSKDRGHLYLSVPIGITVDVLSDDFEGTRDFDVGPGWNVGADLGLAWFFTKGFGLTLEAGYLFHNFFHAYRMEDAEGSGTVVYTLEQRTANLGLVLRY